MTINNTLIIAVTLVFIAGCSAGPRIEESDLGRDPHGAEVEVQLRHAGQRCETPYEGELIGIDDRGTVLLRTVDDNEELIIIRWEDTYRVKLTSVDNIQMTLRQSEDRDPERMDLMRLVSRFPQGLSDDLLTRLLAAYGQDALTQGSC